MQYWIQAPPSPNHFSLFRAGWIRYAYLVHLPISICGLPVFLLHSLGSQYHCIPPFILLPGIVPGEILFQFCYLLDVIWTRFLAVHVSCCPIVVCQHLALLWAFVILSVRVFVQNGNTVLLSSLVCKYWATFSKIKQSPGAAQVRFYCYFYFGHVVLCIWFKNLSCMYRFCGLYFIIRWLW